MEFPHRDEQFTWTLLEDDPFMKVHDGLPTSVRMEFEHILQSDGDRLKQLGQLATKYPEHKRSIVRVIRSEKELQKILSDELTAYGKLDDLKKLHAATPDFKSHITRAMAKFEPVSEITQGPDDSHTKIKKLASMGHPDKEMIRTEIGVLRRRPPRHIQDEINHIVMRSRHVDHHIRRLMLHHLSKSDATHDLFAPAIMGELDSSKIVEHLGIVADQVAAVFESEDLATVLHGLTSLAHQHPEYKDKIDSLIRASITDELDFINRKSTMDASSKMKALGGIMNTLRNHFPEYMDEDTKALIFRRIKEQSKRVSRSGGNRKRRKSRKRR
jgi:hypothetical protein